METTSNYVGIYHNLVKSGLLNNVNSKTSLELTHQNIIPLSRVNQFFFGTNLFVGKLNNTILHKESIITKHDGQYYLYISKLEKYLDANTDRLFITTDTYSALMDIRERLKGEITQYEREQKRVSNPLIQKRISDEKERWAKKLKEWFF